MARLDQLRTREILVRYFEEIFARADSEMEGLAGWCEVKPRIMPRIQPTSVFQHLSRDLVTYRPWVNDTVITFVLDSPGSTISLQKEQIDRWRVSIEEVDEIATTNLCCYAPLPDLEVRRDTSGGKIVTGPMNDGYDSARILNPELRERLAEELGQSFYVGIPARDHLFAFSTKPEIFVSKLTERIGSAFKRLPYPISPYLFLVTRDGIAGTMEREEEDQ
jgi:uncharacterized protein YtpQ (UPF0354 family)